MTLSSDFQSLRRDGFLALPTLFTQSQVEEVRELLDPLFDRFQSLPAAYRRDLGGDAPNSHGLYRSAEINRATTLEPRLRRTFIYRRCRSIARDLGVIAPGYVFDHSIYKAPHNQRATPWHQDHAYTGQSRVLRTLHFWIPLQEATLSNGCMQFIPGSHLAGPQPHHPGNQSGHVLASSTPTAAEVVTCPLPLGGASVHMPLTMHYTGPNASDTTRKAWILHFGSFGRLAKLHPTSLWERMFGARPSRT